MVINKISVTAFMAAFSVAAIATAPIAAAAPPTPGQSAQGATITASGSGVPQPCLGLGGTQSLCQSQGNVQINDSPPQVDYFPYAGGGT